MSFDEPTVRLSETPPMRWGSDALAEVLSRLDLPYIALNPGASYRGLHDSIVNYSGNEAPTMVLCLHEEHAVAVAHGYAKVTGRPLAVGLHSNVGLMHAAMALFNAFCDRVPMLVIGATGPVDAAERRPWIDWIHTAADQGALIRTYVKWDDQPASPAAAVESLVRADVLTRTYPSAPTYVCLDAAIQEAPLQEPCPMPDLERRLAFSEPWPGGPAFEQALALLAEAKRPAILVGRVSRSEVSWDERIALAERLGAAVVCDLKVGAGFPSAHPLAVAAPSTFLGSAAAAAIRDADVILSLDWVDLGGTIRQAREDGPVSAKVISATNDHVLHNGWSKDHFELPELDVAMTAHPDLLVSALLDALPAAGEPVRALPAALAAAGRTAGGDASAPSNGAVAPAGKLTVRAIARSLDEALQGRERCLVRLPLGWDGADLSVAHPLDYLGQDGGAGIGSGPGMTVGAALALRGSSRLPVAVLGDGDFMMGSSALWTATHYELPLLIVVANNRSFFNDEVHQERIALRRDRPVQNRWLGQQIREPDPDLAGIARALGLIGHGPIEEADALDEALAQAVAEAAAGAAVVVDVRITALGYPGGPNMSRKASSQTPEQAASAVSGSR